MIRPEVLLPTREQVLRAGVVGLLGGLVASGLALAGVAVTLTEREPERQPPVVIETLKPVMVPVAAPIPAPIVIPPAALPADPVGMVFSVAGETYLKLGDLTGKTMPRTGKLTMTEEGANGPLIVVGSVSAADLDFDTRAWAERAVRLDTGCEASVAGFAVVSRLTGDPAYASVEGTTWSVDDVFRQGGPVIAARLAGCDKGSLGRDAEMPAMATLTAVDDVALAARARDAFLTSPIAAVAQAEYGSAEGKWHDGEGALTTRVLRHPDTRVTWVAVTGYYTEGCGGADINVLGLYRVDAAGALEPIVLRDLGPMYQVDSLVDIDADGTPELVGRDWLGLERLVMRAQDDVVFARDGIAFYGCPC